MVIISRYASCHGPLAPNSERRIVATKFAVISPKCRSRLAASGAKRPFVKKTKVSRISPQHRRNSRIGDRATPRRRLRNENIAQSPASFCSPATRRLRRITYLESVAFKRTGNVPSVLAAMTKGALNAATKS
jgi:hypothetical protein